jgi:uncharacterized protein
MVDYNLISEWAKSLVREFKPIKIILFGSYAYGIPQKDSDVDLLVVMPHGGSAARVAAKIRLALPADISADVIVRSEETLQERINMNDYFIREIIEKGKVLYAASNA